MTTPSEPTSIVCRVCGTENPATRQFCRKCAADLRAPIPAPGTAPAPEPAPVPARPILLGGGLALLAVIVLLGTVMFLNGGGTSATPTAPAATAAPPSASGPAETFAATPEPSAGPTTASTPQATPAGTVRPPRIRSFIAPDAVPCEQPSHSGFILVSWEVRNATGVTISIDGPGIYQEYEGREARRVELPFTCEAPHTYLLTTVGGIGPPATREVVVTPLYPESPAPSESLEASAP